MKNMSYRDKMIILVISIIIILVAGFFALIKPAYDNLTAHQATYESTKTEWDGIEQKINAIPALKDGITNAVTEAKKDAAVLENTAFGDLNKDYDNRKVNFGLDQYIEEAIDENNLAVYEMAIGDAGECDIEYSYYEPNVVTYALLESGDVNGNYAEEVSDLLNTGTVIEEKEIASVAANNIEMNVIGTKESLMNFLEKMKSDKNAINVQKIEIADYTFRLGEEEEETTPVRRPAAEGEEEEADTGLSAMQINMMFYNAKPIDNPDLGD